MQIDATAASSASRRSRPSPKTIPGDPEHCLASMGIYVFNARFLFDQLCRDATLPDSRTTSAANIIPSIIDTHRVLAFPFLRREPQAGRLLARRRHARRLLRGQHGADGRRSAAQPVRRPLADAHLSAEPAAAEVRVRRDAATAPPRRRRSTASSAGRDHLRRPGRRGRSSGPMLASTATRRSRTRSSSTA